MKKQLVILAGSILLQTTNAYTAPLYANRIGRFLLTSLDNGMNGKKWAVSLGVGIIVTTIIHKYKDFSFKKTLAYGLSATVGSAFVIGSIKTTKDCMWPSQEKIQERIRLKQKLAESLKQIEYLDTEGKRLAQEKINEIAARQKALEHTIAQRNIKNAFYKNLAENENSPLNAEGFPIPCEALAQQFRTLCGEELYQKELADFKKWHIVVTENRQRAQRLNV